MLTFSIGVLAAAFTFYLITDRRRERYNDPSWADGHDRYSSQRNYDPWDKYYLPRERRDRYEDYRRDDNYDRQEEIRRYEQHRQRQRDDVGSDMMTVFMIALVFAAFFAYLRYGG